MTLSRSVKRTARKAAIWICQSVIPIHSEDESIASADWKGDKLEFKLLNNAGQPTEFETIDTWSLSPDGKKLTSDIVVHLPKNGGESRVRRVFDRKN